MLRKHIDFVAIFFVAVAMFAISQAPSVAIGPVIAIDPIDRIIEAKTAHFENAGLRLQTASRQLQLASEHESCAIKREFLSSLAALLNE